MPPIQRGNSANLQAQAVAHAAGQRKKSAIGVGSALNYESDTTAISAPTRLPANQASYGYLDGNQELTENSYSVVPLNNRG